MGKQSTTVKKRLVRKLGIYLDRYFHEPKYLQLVFEEWPLIEKGSSVVFIRVLEEDAPDDDDRFGISLSRNETTELIKFLEDALANTPA